jgi:pimeloyl-ACP methyl ester carboxylesterase
LVERSGHIITSSIGECLVDLRGKGRPVAIVSIGRPFEAESEEIFTSGLAKRFNVVTVGLPIGERLNASAVDIDGFAGALGAVFESLGIDTISLFGHHAAALVAGEFAAAHPHRVDRLVLSGTPLWTESRREELSHRLHYAEDNDTLDRYLIRADTFRAGQDVSIEDLDGTVGAVAASIFRYDARNRFPRVLARSLVLNSLSDPFGQWLFELAELIPNAEPAMVADGPLYGELDGETLVANLNEFLG